MFDWLMLATGVYLMWLAMMMSTKNIQSMIIFKLMPGVAGILWIVKAVLNFGWLQ